MKRWLFLIAALLVFSGCAADPEVPTTAPLSVTEAPGLESPGSMMEVSTSGSVQVYPLNRTGCTGAVPMGSNLLLFSGTDVTTLTLLEGEELTSTAEITLGCVVSPDSPALHVTDQSITYYDETTRELVTLDKELSEASRFPLPETMLGAPALSPDGQLVYYCCADSVRCIDLDTRLDKLLKEMELPSQAVTGLHRRGTILECTVTDDDGEIYTIFLSAQTGETLCQISGTITLYALEGSYLALHMDGSFRELLVGSDGDAARLLSCGADPDAAASAENLNLAVVTHTYEKENITVLECYEPISGIRTASLTIPGGETIRGITGGIDDNGIWFLHYDESLKTDIFCRWDPALNPVEDDTCYLAKRYTEDDPDTEGLTRCADTAASLSETYGVEILTWQDIAPCITNEYPLEAEYQVSLIESSLQQLEAALSRYPEGFLEQAAAATDSGVLKISLVRSAGSREKGAQYWTDDSACIALCVGSNLEQEFHHQLFYLLENRVLSKCSIYDTWNSLNPKDFDYTLDIDAAMALEDTTWLEGEDRAFINQRSMSFPREDRAAIMEYAMMSGNEAYFESEVMQQKLSKLCQGIRKAFGLKKSEEVFLWEQYLDEPLNK